MDESSPKETQQPSASKPKLRSLLKEGEPYTQVSQWLMRDGRIKIEARSLYVILAGYRNGSCDTPFPSLPTLSKDSGLGRKAIQRHLKELEEWGLLVRHRMTGTGSWKSTRYELKPYPFGPREKSPKRPRIRIKRGGQNGPTSINHSTGSLQLSTALPESPSAIGRMKHDSRCHSHSCMCIDCRAVKERIEP